MAISVKHNFVSEIEDDTYAAASGKVLPSHWNEEHVLEGFDIGVHTQAHAAILDSISELEVEENTLVYFGEEGKSALTILTEFGRVLLEANNRLDAISKLGLGAEVNEILRFSSNQNDLNLSFSDMANSARITMVRIAPTNSIKITGISSLGVADGKRIVIKNTTSATLASGRMILIERESPSSAANNRFLYSASASIPIILMPGDQVEFIYSQVTQRWDFLCGNRHGSAKNFFDLFEDILGSYGSMLTLGSGTGAGGGLSTTFVSDATQKALGTFLVGTGTDTTGYAYWASQSDQLMGGSGACCFIGRANPTVLSDGTDTYKASLGLTDAAGTGAIVDGIYWQYDQGTDTVWRTGTSSNSSATVNSVSGFTVDTTKDYAMGFFVNGDWTNVEYFYSLDGVSWSFVSTQITTDIPTGTSRLFGCQAGITKSAGTTSRFLSVDYLGFRYDQIRGS